MVWWSFVLGIVGGILLCCAAGVYIMKHTTKSTTLEDIACTIDWLNGKRDSIDEPQEESNQD